MNFLDIDILGIGETHLTCENNIEIAGYTWIGHNRANLHRKARVGSGGVGLLYKKELSNVYHVSVLNNSYEGILWTKFTQKNSEFTFLVCVCYLPPENSSRQVDVVEYLDTLTSQLYSYQNLGPFYLCGDFNARCGDSEDFIVGVDNVPQRNVVDFKTNKSGDLLIDFLINVNCCILNGRNHIQNDFTYISNIGRSVVDYCLVPYENVNQFSEFKVWTATDLLQEAQCVDVLDASSKVPDHSVITWSINLMNDSANLGISNGVKTGVKKYNLKSIDGNFAEDSVKLQCVMDKIHELERVSVSQQCLDNLYTEFVEALKSEMDLKLEPRDVRINSGDKQIRRKAKPWWNKELSLYWNEVRLSEKQWLKDNTVNKNISLGNYKNKRKLFDKEVRKAKRQYWYRKQNDLSELTSKNQPDFWKEFGKIGIGAKRAAIPMEIITENGDTCEDVEQILQKWEDDFKNLLNCKDSNNSDRHDGSSDEIVTLPVPDDIMMKLNADISLEEVHNALQRAKDNKATGCDDIPSEVLKNTNTANILVKLFNTCFVNSIIPNVWKRSIINPIPKSSSKDPRDPLGYRGISLAPSSYKLYCSVLNERLNKFVTELDIINDNQNGFRKKRSTADHIISLSTVIETRKSTRLPTFAAFIDFKTAYDKTNRNLLFSKLLQNGISGRFYDAIKTIYAEVKSCVRINGLKTNWFDINCGLKQGCLLSPIFFNLYVNDIVQSLSELGVGIDIGGEKLSILLYADDIVLLAESESDLQKMLDVLNVWVSNNSMVVNFLKSNVVHFRNNAKPRTSHVFTCGNDVIDISDSYVYLGVLFTEHLDYNQMAKHVSKSASRALGLLIAKTKCLGGVPYDTFTKLYDCMVYPIISYGAVVWGDREFSCISAVQNRACRYFLGVGKYTPNAAVSGDMGWIPAHMRTWNSVIRQYCRLSNMGHECLAARIFTWAKCKPMNISNWSNRIKKFLIKADLWDKVLNIVNTNSYLNPNLLICDVFAQNSNCFFTKWHNDVTRDTAKRGHGRNKLKMYRCIKQIYGTEDYVKLSILPSHRSALAKFRCGVAPLRIETGRYEGLAVQDRTCFYCKDEIETEEHCLLYCGLYNDLRYELFNFLIPIYPNFNYLSNDEKLSVILADGKVARKSARTCYEILRKRKSFIYL